MDVSNTVRQHVEMIVQEVVKEIAIRDVVDNLVWKITHASPPPLDQPCLEDIDQSTQERRARASVNHAEHAPERHTRPTPTDRAPHSPRAYMIATDPGDRQTSPFAAP